MSTEAGIDQGRAAFREHRWTDAFENFLDADRRGGLPAADLERLATAEILTGNTTAGLETLTRAHEEFLEVGDVAGAARCAGWMGIQLSNLGEMARAGGWLARGQRLATELDELHAVQGLLLMPQGLGKLYGGDPAGALEVFTRAAEIARLAQDRDVTAWHSLAPGKPTSCSAGQTRA
ncbi:hypothetical protein [Arthrobacter nitrophenolicus]|uniref:hypothetical protein n=1 Tax=Arthrobacter nitrophenolicus TaxID=683150 RepID=UPI00034684A5